MPVFVLFIIFVFVLTVVVLELNLLIIVSVFGLISVLELVFILNRGGITIGGGSGWIAGIVKF